MQLREEILERNKNDLVQKAAMENEKNSRGLPVAVQIVARPNQEQLVLSVMKLLEDASKLREDYPINVLKRQVNKKEYSPTSIQ